MVLALFSTVVLIMDFSTGSFLQPISEFFIGWALFFASTVRQSGLDWDHRIRKIRSSHGMIVLHSWRRGLTLRSSLGIVLLGLGLAGLHFVNGRVLHEEDPGLVIACIGLAIALLGFLSLWIVTALTSVTITPEWVELGGRGEKWTALWSDVENVTRSRLLDVAVGDTEMRTSLTMDVRFSDPAGGTRERTVTIPTEEFAVDADELGALLEAVWRAPAPERRRVIDGWPATPHTV